MTVLRPCPGRHWFAYYGWVGSSSPFCVRCGHPNPNYDRHADPYWDGNPSGRTEGDVQAETTAS